MKIKYDLCLVLTRGEKGTGVKNKKLAKDLKKRQELLEAYRAEIGSLKKKLQNDLDEEEDEKSVE